MLPLQQTHGPERSPYPGDLIVHTISDPRWFRALRNTWDGLVERAGIAHPFLSHECVWSWWQNFGAGKELHIAVVTEKGGEPIAIAPMMLWRSQLWGAETARLELIGDVHTPRSDFIVASRPEAARTALWAHLRKAEWDVLIMPRVPAESPTLPALAELAHRDGLLTGAWEAPPWPWLEFSGTFEHYVASLPASHRRNVRNRMRRLQRLGRIEVETVDDPDAIEAALEDGFRIEAAGWKGAAGTAIASRDETRRFYAQMAGPAARRGWLKLQFLTLDGRRISFMYGLEFGGAYYLLKQGYDPEFAPFSPSTLLLFLMLEQGFARGLSGLDFLGEDDPWKRQWTQRVRRQQWLFVFPPRLRMRFVHLLKFRVWPWLKERPPIAAARAALLKRAPHENGAPHA